MKFILFSNKIRSQQVASVPIALINPISTSKLRSALHFRYSLVTEAGLGIPSPYFYFHSTFAKLLFLYIYRIVNTYKPIVNLVISRRKSLNIENKYKYYVTVACRID